ncbi:alpha/beta hydrolase-fold protein [Planctomicrobium sp. SH664]|uniref:carboxylesterase family protein n=1 Tax=Planctomicrobium sp. SH664 TaxID=3448125 RepID=UPI003F5B6511
MPGTSRFGALWICWLLVCMASATGADSDSTPPLPPGFEQRIFRDAAGDHRYVVFRPRSDSPAKRWPVVLYLHGAGEMGRDGLLPLAGQLASALEQNPDAPFVAVFPQCEEVNGRALTNWLADSPDGQRALKILEQVEQTESIDPQRRVIAGCSMGGYGTWSLAAADPAHWSAALIISGGGDLDTLQLEPLARQRLPVWAVHGTADEIVSSQSSQQLIARLNELGGRGTLTLVPQAGHDVWRRVFADPQSFRWMLDPVDPPPAAEQLLEVQPLPPSSRFYREVLTQRYRIPRSVGLRLGNQALAEIAPELPTMFPGTSLEGELPDIRRSIGSGAQQIDVVFSEVRYHCSVQQCELRAISGGRFLARFELHPLELSIGGTELTGEQDQATAGPFRVLIGRRRPAVLQVEVQPCMVDGRLKLRLLREKFEIDPDNWYITPPEILQLRSDRYSRSNIVTGVVGSLYLNREEMAQQVLQTVPRILETVERELSSRNAPRLARLLSPLPVLVPELSLSTAQVRTDRDGLSLIFDLTVLTRGAGGTGQLEHPQQLEGYSHQPGIALGMSLEAATAVSQLTIDQKLAQVNVQDIGDPRFAQFADPKVMAPIVSGISLSPDVALRTVLRLVDPVRVSADTSSTPSLAAPEAPTILLPLQLSSQRIALDFWALPQLGQPQPLGSAEFLLSQPLVIESVAEDAATHREPGLQIRWLRDCEVTFLDARPLAGSRVPQVDGRAFEQLVKEAWLSWSEDHRIQQIDLNAARIGQTRIQLQSIDVADEQLLLQLRTDRDSQPEP